MMATHHEDLHFMPDVHAAARRRGHGSAYILTIMTFVFVVVFGTWANYAVLDEVTRGEGRVIPSSKTQIIQNLEGGILAEILVREGDIVDEAQVLLRIDDTSHGANLRENQARYFGLQAKIARLEGEVSGAAPSFPADLEAALAADEMALYRSRRAELAAAVGTPGSA